MPLQKPVCECCCAVEKVASYREGEQVGKPLPWSDEDDLRWKNGEVHCPHRRQEEQLDKALGRCLKRGAHEGCLLVGEEDRADE